MAKGKRRRKSGAARRPKLPGARVHNAPRGKWIDVCGQVTRVGGALVEIPSEKKQAAEKINPQKTG